MVNEPQKNVGTDARQDFELVPTITTPSTRPSVISPTAFSQFLRPAQSDDELGRLAHFKITRLLGQGGMGMVFEAIDLQLNRPVALKVIHPATQSDAVARERFLNEARACAALRHDHIVPIYQVGEDQGVIFLAMPLLTGQSLDRWLRSHPIPDLRQILRIGWEVADGLAAAHTAGIVHRDIKMANIWLEDPQERVILLDFGLATRRDGDANETKDSFCFGTPGYMAPEQAQGNVSDHRGDLFSLGVVLYRLCTGKMPFTIPESAADYFSAVMEHAVQPPMEVRKDIPPALDDLIMTLLARQPELRPENAKAVRTALQNILETESKQGQERIPHALNQQISILPGQRDSLRYGQATQGVRGNGLSHDEPVTEHRRPSVSLLAITLLLGSIVAMGFWIYETPTAHVRPTLSEKENAGVIRINVRSQVQRIGLVRAPLVKEASALVKSRKHPGIYWTLCDSGNPAYLFAIEASGKLIATLRVDGVQNIDWEAMTSDDAGHLYVGDIGNNYLRHKTRSIYQIVEPDLLTDKPGHEPRTVPVTAQWHFTYPDRLFDAESLVIQDGAFWLISKSLKLAETRLYRLPMHPAGTTQVLEETGVLSPEMLSIADASLSPDSKRLALVNKFYAVVYDLPNGKISEIPRLQPRYYEYDLFKVEGCAWDGDDLILIAEDRKIYRLSLPKEQRE